MDATRSSCWTSLLRAIAVGILALGGCVPTPPTPPADEVLSGTIQDWTLGPAGVEARVDDGSGTARVVGQGSVEGSGAFTLTLEGQLDAGLLLPIALCGSATVSDADAAWRTVSEYAISQNGAVGGPLRQVSSREVYVDGLRALGDYYLQQTYADRAVTISGSCTVGGVVEATFSYDQALQAGWNLVKVELVAKSATRQTLSFETVATLPAGARWMFIDPSGGGGASDAPSAIVVGQ